MAKSPSSWARRAAGVLILAALLGWAGCATPVETGPNPARISVKVAAAADPQEMASVDNRARSRMGFDRRFVNIFGPYWSLNAYLVEPGGKKRPLPSDPGRPFELPVGPMVRATGAFLAPPGANTFLIELTGRARLSWEERLGAPARRRSSDGQVIYDETPWQSRTEVYQVQHLAREVTLELSPGQAVELKLPQGH